MKRKYAALVLGLSLSLTSMHMVYATESADTQETEVQPVEEAEALADDMEELSKDKYGMVKEITDDSITVEVIRLVPGEKMAAPEKPVEEAEAEEAEAEKAETEEVAEAEAPAEKITEAAEKNIEDSVYEKTEEEATYTITEDTVFEREYYKEGEAENGATTTVTDSETEVSEETAEENAETEEAETTETDSETASEKNEILFQGEKGSFEYEAITPDDIEVGDVVMILFDDDNNAEYITVLDYDFEIKEAVLTETAEEPADQADENEAEETDVAETEEETTEE